jgi:Fe-S oxidoreductase
MARWGSRCAPVSNLIAGSRPVRWLNERLLGLDRRRVPPAWASGSFTRRFSREFPPPSDTTSASAFIFNDTFTNYYNPGVGIAGARVLERAGHRPSLAPNVCCGRPLISQGLLSEARDLVRRNTAALFPLADRGHHIVFFEPSCLSAVREDAPSLVRGDDQRQARRVAESSLLFEDFLNAVWPPTLHARTGPATILLHGHCHQKAMGLVAPAKTLLERIPGARVIDLNAGCCGMAGSFGYMRETFDVSSAIGERKLLPAARAQKADSVLVASGVSCRHQVRDLANARALHPAELLFDLTQPASLERA